MRKTHSLKVRRCAAYLIDINEYLYVFPGAKESDRICETEFNDILLNSMPNNCIRKVYVKGFDFESIT